MSTQGLEAATPFWGQDPPFPDRLEGKLAHFLTLGLTLIPSYTKLLLCQGFGHGIHTSCRRPDFAGRPCCRGVTPKTTGLSSRDLDRNPRLANSHPCLISSCLWQGVCLHSWNQEVHLIPFEMPRCVLLLFQAEEWRHSHLPRCWPRQEEGGPARESQQQPPGLWHPGHPTMVSLHLLGNPGNTTQQALGPKRLCLKSHINTHPVKLVDIYTAVVDAPAFHV